MMARPVAVLGALAMALLADAALAQDVRALITEQQGFVQSLARGRQNNNVWQVEWRNEALARRDGTATGGMSTADVQHFNGHRTRAQAARFLAWAEGNEPGLRASIDRAFLAIATPVQLTGYTGTSQQFLTSTVEPRKNAEVRQLLDLLHRATARLSREATARGLPQPLVAGANGVTPALPPAVPPVTAAPGALPGTPAPNTGGSLLGLNGGVAGRALPGGYVPPPGLPQPAQPIWPGQSAYPTPYPYPQNQNITITLDPRTLQQLLALVMWMQRTGQMPGMTMPGMAMPGMTMPGQMQVGQIPVGQTPVTQTPWPPAVNPGQFGTGSYWDQAMRGQGIRIVFR